MMKSSILDELVRANRMPVLFVGSGISKRYLFGYPSWEELLEKSFEKFETDPFQYQKHLDECRRKKMSDFDTNVYMWCCIIKVDTLFSRILIYNHNQYENRRNNLWHRIKNLTTMSLKHRL